MPDRKLFLETTQVPAAKSLGEITSELVRAGARAIETQFDAGKPSGLRWSMRIYNVDIWFSLPVRVEPVHATLLRRRKIKPVSLADKAALQQLAERVAWRQLLMWVKVQMALVDLGMVEFAQVFLPYAMEASGVTMWDAFRGHKFKQIPGQ